MALTSDWQSLFTLVNGLCLCVVEGSCLRTRAKLAVLDSRSAGKPQNQPKWGGKHHALTCWKCQGPCKSALARGDKTGVLYPLEACRVPRSACLIHSLLD